MCLGPKIGVWRLKIVIKLNFGLILWVLKWGLIGSMGFMHTNSGSDTDLTHMLSSFIQIHEPGPKIGIWLL